ncbi:GntR family transcriptional regulator [Desemzia sp. RIT804]|uniref:GntR family transcriptional regulator n=1 Tax=Desemzia sp. RIT 804 TaxID=2810209 RepID=UPI00194E5904|nr:GntR family transcriptional regulator [Desemzia sp. RIT 804]MBM6614374.1 GntR family transcriptional regulator [Desemzia sp. RIT 804]
MVKSKNLETQAYLYIKEKIETRQWLPKTHITEQDLSQELGISRTPIRRAFLRLQKEDVLEIIPHKGASIQEQAVDNKGFQDRLGFIEMILNNYLHQIQIREIAFEVSELEHYIKSLSNLTGKQQEKEFYAMETKYWQEFVRYAKNTYNVALFMDTLRSLNHQKNEEIQDVLSESRELKVKYLTQLTKYLAESQYAYARKEIRILLNQISLAIIQGI